MTNINVDGKEYKIEDLNEKAKAQVMMLEIVNKELIRIEGQLAIAKTAKNLYAQSLNPNLPKKEAPKNRKKDVVSINGKKYFYKDMNEKAIQNLVSLGAVDKKIAILQSELSITKTAKSAYENALKKEI